MNFPKEATGTELGLDLLSTAMPVCRPCARRLSVQGSQWQREDMEGWRLTSEPSPFQEGSLFLS